MLPHAKITAAVLLLMSAFFLGARARELRGGAEREPEKMRRLAVPKGSNCNTNKLNEMRNDLFKKKPKCQESMGRLVDTTSTHDTMDTTNATKIIEDFCTKDSCAADLTEVAQRWRDWCASPDGTARLVESESNKVAADPSFSSMQLLGYILEMGCTKQTSGTDAGYCAGKLFNMSAVVMDEKATDDEWNAGVCPAYSSCCFPEFSKTSNAWGDDITKDMEEDCPGSQKAANLTTCA